AYNYHTIFRSLKVRDVWIFYVARLARIYPVHVLAFVVFLIVALGSWSQLFTPRCTQLFDHKALANLTLTQSYIADATYYFSWNGPSWSLSDEFFFYAALPLLLWGM